MHGLIYPLILIDIEPHSVVFYLLLYRSNTPCQLASSLLVEKLPPEPGFGVAFEHREAILWREALCYALGQILYPELHRAYTGKHVVIICPRGQVAAIQPQQKPCPQY